MLRFPFRVPLCVATVAAAIISVPDPIPKMPPKILPGRPSTLDSSQSKALKDLWLALFSVFQPRNSSYSSGKSAKDPGDKYAQEKDFQDALASNAPQDLRSAFWRMVKHDNPDALLLRFLRARKWDVDRALVMLVSTIHWRLNTVQVEQLLEQGEQDFAENDPDTIKQVRMGKSFTYGYDLFDRPVVYIRTRLHHSSDQSQESTQKYTIFLMETIRLFLKEPVDQSCILFDLTDFSISNMDYPPIKFLIKCLEAHYPECLGRCIIHRAPWIFQGIWNVIKGWLDPVVASKFVFTRSAADLEKFISPDQLIKEVGGNDPFEYVYIEPNPDENDLLKDSKTLDKILLERDEIVDHLEKFTRTWCSNGNELDAQRKELIHRLCKNYARLDPYVRARSIYDRIKTLKVE